MRGSLLFSLKEMLRAIIFDCDGGIADTEPIHMAALQQVLHNLAAFQLEEAERLLLA